MNYTPGWNAFNGADMTGLIIPDYCDGCYYGSPSVMLDGWILEHVSVDHYIDCTNATCLWSPCGISWGGSNKHLYKWRKVN